MKKITLFILSFFVLLSIKADEGMWMLPLIEKLNIQKMSGLGLTITSEDIYSETDNSLKDAVIIFGNGCTGVMVSNQGLIFTNHHCGYSAIQELSSVEHNYLKNGFTAQTLAEELHSPNLTVKFLVKIEDITDKVLVQIPEHFVGSKRQKLQDSICKTIEDEASQGNNYISIVKPFFSGNQFYLTVYEEFKDVRLAYTPPSSIGKFGGDTDNWMWPRHTGDFAVFRVYASPDGKPADYSDNNVPYSPKKFAAISTKGYESGDYAMILGNPGTTNRYLSSWGIYNRKNASNRARIDVRGEKQDVWKSFMEKDEAIQIAYASKYARSSNYWKNSIGMNNAIDKQGIFEQKQIKEQEFAKWVEQSESTQRKYGKVLEELEKAYTGIYPYEKTRYYFIESLFTGVEFPRLIQRIEGLLLQKTSTDSLITATEALYHDYYAEVDKATLIAMLDVYKKHVEADALPNIYETIDKKFKSDYVKYADDMFKKSVFSSHEKLSAAIKKKSFKWTKDPMVIYLREIENTFKSIQSDDYNYYSNRIDDAEHLYEAGLLEKANETGEELYPDANFTMRLTYGTIGAYKPADAVYYNYFTTTEGVLEKEIKGDSEFDVPVVLKQAINSKEYAPYTDSTTGKMHVNFISNNDITGGNSGSPVFDADGNLLGLAFDGNWEALSGDIIFEPNLQRCINVDVRYILFIMDKVGNAQRLIEELSIY